MKKLSVALLTLVVAFAITAVAQDSSSSSGSSGSTASASKSTTVKGWVSDEKCGAQGAGAAKAACAKKCVAGGQKIVFVSDKDKKVWNVDNPDALTDHIGHHVAVTGTVDASAGTVHVDSVKMLGHKKAAKAS